MPIGVYIQLNPVGAEVGPTVDLFSDLDGYTTPFETNVSVSLLSNGYWFNTVPTGTKTIKVQSYGECTNHILINITGLPGCDDNYCLEFCCSYLLENNSGGLRSWSYYDCEGGSDAGLFNNGDIISFCADQSAGPIFVDSGCTLTRVGCCYECSCYTVYNQNQSFTIEYTDCYGNIQTQVSPYNGSTYIISYCGGEPTVIFGTYDEIILVGDCLYNGISYYCPF